jgi:nicotinate-nucleotide adenylyltransferase
LYYPFGSSGFFSGQAGRTASINYGLKSTRSRHGVRRIGICGGTFDPVHHGHLILAQDALEELALDRVLFVPCARSPHKLRHRSSPARHRLAMLRMALKGHRQFEVSSCEIDRGGISYAIDTLDELRLRHSRAKFFWLIGDDQLPKLHTWKQLDELRRGVTFVCAARATREHRGRVEITHLKHSRRIDISSSEIRARAKAGKPINQLVPGAVADYITRFRLYR